MRHLNGEYSQHFNRRHRAVGHLFQGRYKAILVQKESYLLELSRYIVLNPLRSHMVDSLDDWPWSSHRYYVGDVSAPCWLEQDWRLSQFGTSRNLGKPDRTANGGMCNPGYYRDVSSPAETEHTCRMGSPHNGHAQYIG